MPATKDCVQLDLQSKGDWYPSAARPNQIKSEILEETQFNIKARPSSLLISTAALLFQTFNYPVFIKGFFKISYPKFRWHFQFWSVYIEDDVKNYHDDNSKDNTKITQKLFHL